MFLRSRNGTPPKRSEGGVPWRRSKNIRLAPSLPPGCGASFLFRGGPFAQRPDHCFVLIEGGQVDMPKPNGPKSIRLRRKGDVLPRKRLAQEQPMAVPVKHPIALHLARRNALVIARARRSAHIAPRRSSIRAGRSKLSQRLMRPHLIVLAAKGLKTMLLRAQSLGRWIGGLGFQGAVH